MVTLTRVEKCFRLDLENTTNEWNEMGGREGRERTKAIKREILVCVCVWEREREENRGIGGERDREENRGIGGGERERGEQREGVGHREGRAGGAERGVGGEAKISVTRFNAIWVNFLKSLAIFR